MKTQKVQKLAQYTTQFTGVIAVLFSLGCASLSPTPPPMAELRAKVIENKPYGDEAKDWDIKPIETYRTGKKHAPTPLTHPQAKVINTFELRQKILSANPPLLIQAMRDGEIFEETIPTAKIVGKMSWTGKSGDVEGLHAHQKSMLNILSKGDKNREIVVFCASSKCWLSYNAAFNVVKHGYKNVYWYRGGFTAWYKAGLPRQVVQAND